MTDCELNGESRSGVCQGNGHAVIILVMLCQLLQLRYQEAAERNSYKCEGLAVLCMAQCVRHTYQI